MIVNKSKEQGRLLKFPKVNILEQSIDSVNESLKVKRNFFLKKASKETLKIFFLDKNGMQKIETTIWTVSEKALILKDTTVLPLSNIVAVA